MKFALILFVSVAGISANDQRSVAKDSDPVPKNNNQLCVYANLSKYDKKIVCGDPAPSSLAQITPKISENPTAPSDTARGFDDKCFGKKGYQNNKPLAVFVQQPGHQYYQAQNYAQQPLQPVVYEQAPIVEPQVQQLQPVVYEQAQVVEPQVQYQPYYQKPQFVPIVIPQRQQHPLKALCNFGGGGFGSYKSVNGGLQVPYPFRSLDGSLQVPYPYRSLDGSLQVPYPHRSLDGGLQTPFLYGSANDEYTPLLKTVETNHFVNDVPVMHSVEAAIPPYDEIVARKGFAGPKNVFRPNAIVRPVFKASADQYGVVASPPPVPEPIDSQSHDGVQQFVRVPEKSHVVDQFSAVHPKVQVPVPVERFSVVDQFGVVNPNVRVPLPGERSTVVDQFGVVNPNVQVSVPVERVSVVDQFGVVNPNVRVPLPGERSSVVDQFGVVRSYVQVPVPGERVSFVDQFGVVHPNVRVPVPGERSNVVDQFGVIRPPNVQYAVRPVAMYNNDGNGLPRSADVKTVTKQVIEPMLGKDEGQKSTDEQPPDSAPQVKQPLRQTTNVMKSDQSSIPNSSEATQVVDVDEIKSN